MLLLRYFSSPGTINQLIYGPLGKISGFKVDNSVITYTLLCGYSPFRSEDRDELIEETVRARVVRLTVEAFDE